MISLAVGNCAAAWAWAARLWSSAARLCGLGDMVLSYLLGGCSPSAVGPYATCSSSFKYSSGTSSSGN